MTLSFEDIDDPIKLKTIPANKLQEYSHWLRQFLITKIAELGGHFAANLGVVELTVALHYVYNTPEDILVWDVGHQAYAHKILSGRKSDFDSLRKKDGISGFPKMSESTFDAFGTGHSSTSVSAVLGYAIAAKLQGIDRQHIAVIGDGALSAGQAFEALNNAAESNTNITIIINDNHIGIDPSSGAMGEYLDQLEYKSDNLFNDFGFEYFGPVDGHNITELLTVLETTRQSNQPKVIHVRTVKGKGYAPAEAEQTKWHSTSRFDKVSGKNTPTEDNGIKYQDIFGRTLLELAEKENRIVAVTPAMISGSSLHFMQNVYKERVFDVGIAEQHAVTFSAGLAASGLIPFCCIYSTFLQRAYDQLIHDVALQNLHVIFAVDRAGLVGEDGPTHHGVFDLSFLQTVPNICILSPSDQTELRNAMYTAVHEIKGPVIIRYPRGGSGEKYNNSEMSILPVSKSVCLKKKDSQIALISVGTIKKNCIEALEGLDISHYDVRYVKPFDTGLLHELYSSCSDIFIVEESQQTGGFASTVLLHAAENNFKGRIHSIGIGDAFSPQGSMPELYRYTGLDKEHLREKILAKLKI